MYTYALHIVHMYIKCSVCLHEDALAYIRYILIYNIAKLRPVIRLVCERPLPKLDHLKIPYTMDYNLVNIYIYIYIYISSSSMMGYLKVQGIIFVNTLLYMA